MRTIGQVTSFILVAAFVTCVLFLVLGSIVNAQVENDIKKVVVRDRLQPRVHSLSGMVMVPTDCHQLVSRVSQIDTQNYLLTFRTWENPNLTCSDESVPRQFHLTLFAPSTGVTFQATLDDVAIPLEVIPTIE